MSASTIPVIIDCDTGIDDANALVLAASADNATMWTGIVSLAVFALGLSLPMLAVMLMYQWLKGALGWLRNHQLLIRRIGGGLMILLNGISGLGIFGRWRLPRMPGTLSSCWR